jgi:hypothetical protein
MPIDIDAMSAALAPTRVGLDAAGFDLVILDAGGKLQLKVAARPEACEDCLVPKSLFRRMAADEIREAGLDSIEMEILYPIDARRS